MSWRIPREDLLLASDRVREDEIRAATSRHIRDILREHGYGKRWLSYDIPPEPGRHQASRAYSDRSLMGTVEW